MTRRKPRTTELVEKFIKGRLSRTGILPTQPEMADALNITRSRVCQITKALGIDYSGARRSRYNVARTCPKCSQKKSRVATMCDECIRAIRRNASMKRYICTCGRIKSLRAQHCYRCYRQRIKPVSHA